MFQSKKKDSLADRLNLNDKPNRFLFNIRLLLKQKNICDNVVFSFTIHLVISIFRPIKTNLTYAQTTFSFTNLN